MRRPAKTLLLSLAGAALLSGCGFHLEGRTPLPAVMAHPYLEAQDQQSDFVQSLRRDLLISGAHPAAEAGRASAVVSILQDRVTSRVLSVSATNQPTEYQVTYFIRFSVSASGRPLLAPVVAAAASSESLTALETATSSCASDGTPVLVARSGTVPRRRRSSV